MPTLVYKRTHDGDPGPGGIFGCECCMGRVRGYGFDSVIGIGGIGSWAKSCGIDGRINWIGTGAHVVGKCSHGHPLIAFKHFQMFAPEGEKHPPAARLLKKRFCRAKAARFAIHSFNAAETRQIKRLLASVESQPPSKGTRRRRRRKCPRVC